MPAKATRTRPRKRMIMPATIMTTTITMVISPNTTHMVTMITTIMITTMATRMLMTTNKLPAGGQSASAESEAAALYRLMTWLSPSFPVGAFSYSSGIEWAVEAGDVTDAASLKDWLSSMLVDGAGLCDGIFLAQAHHTASGDRAKLAGVAELASVFVPSRERHLETTAQGRAFIEIARAAWPSPSLDQLVEVCGSTIAYPVAVGIVSAAHHIPLAPTIHAFLHALTSNWISAGARLVPLGQTDAQRLLAWLEPVVARCTRRALAASLADLGSATFRADIASMRHETQYTRMFRS